MGGHLTMQTPKWLFDRLKCVECTGLNFTADADFIRCNICETDYPISNNAILLLKKGVFVDAAEVISKHLNNIDPSAVEKVFATALRYCLKDATLRGEFSGILERYSGVLAAGEGIRSEVRLPQSGSRLKKLTDYFNPVFEAGQDSHRSVRVRNQSDEIIETAGQTPFHLSYWLRTTDGTLIEGVRSRFPIPLHPGHDLTVPLRIAVPSQPGEYEMEVKLVQEFVAWEEQVLVSKRITVKEPGSLRAGLVTPPHNGYYDFKEDIGRSGKVLSDAVNMAFEHLADEGRSVEILEVACGHEPMSLRHYHPNTHVVACDLAFPQVQLGALMFEKINKIAFENSVFIAADMFDLPLRPGSFDVIVISAALHHFADIVEALEIMSSLLRPGGLIVLLREPAKYAPDDPTYISELMNGFNEQQFEIAEYDVMFERSGLKLVYEQLDFECSYKAILRHSGPTNAH